MPKNFGVTLKISMLQFTTMEDLVYRLRKRAEIRLQIPSRKSVQEGRPDRLAELLLEAADAIERLQKEKSDVLDQKD